MARRVSGADVVRRRLRQLRRNAFDALETEVRQQCEITLARSRDLAPQLTGLMIHDSHVTMDSRRSSGSIRAVIHYDQPYAVFQHEGVYNPGPVTSVKLGAQRGIGRKFLQKALDERREQMVVQCGRALERALRSTLR